MVEQRSPKPRAEGSSPSAPAKTKRHLRVSFYFVVKAEGLEPRNSKVLALLTVNSPVDCLRIELIIKPLPKKAPIFRCFFLYLRLFTAILLVFPILIKLRRTVFSIRRLFIFTLFLLILCHTIHAIRLVHHQKSINHNSNALVITYSFYLIFYFLCEFIYADLMLFGNSSGIMLFTLSSFPSFITSL